MDFSFGDTPVGDDITLHPYRRRADKKRIGLGAKYVEKRKFREEIDKQKQEEIREIQNGKPKDRGSSERFNHKNIEEREIWRDM